MWTPGDQLLYIISARHTLSWASFKDVFDHLWLHTKHAPIAGAGAAGLNISYARLATVRALDSLGHCDFDFDTRTVHTAPPALARLPQTGLPQAVLTGSRSPDTIPRLKGLIRSHSATMRVSVRPQPDPALLAPVVVTVQATSVDELARLSVSLGIAFDSVPAAWSMVQLAPSLDEHLSAQRWTVPTELNWPQLDFDPRRLHCFSPKSHNGEIRLSEYTDPVRQVRKHYLVRENQQAEVDRDWGRFAVLHYLGVNVLFHDQVRFTLSVPATVLLPGLLTRALALCSGKLPVMLDCASKPHHQIARLLVFEAVPPQIAELAASKLGQELKELAL